MAPTTSTTHDPALSHGTSAAPVAQAAPAAGNLQNPPANMGVTEINGMHLNGLDQTQIMNLLRSLPGIFPKLPEGQGTKEDAAQALSNLAQGSLFSQHLPVQYQPPAPGGLPGINDPGPSSHPRGPPNLGQLSAVAMQAAPAPIQQQAPRPEDGVAGQAQASSSASAGAKDGEASDGPASTPTPTSTGGRRGGRGAAMGSDEWARQRKDNHKEVERRRRGNINEGINELGRIVPSGSGEKAKGAILARAVQYIHHLKENEARNIEKWTLEKLLMDQAMGDLQAQLEEIKRLWEEERIVRARLEAELDVLRSMNGIPTTSKDDNSAAGTKRRSPETGNAEADVASASADAERDGKRPRTE